MDGRYVHSLTFHQVHGQSGIQSAGKEGHSLLVECTGCGELIRIHRLKRHRSPCRDPARLPWAGRLSYRFL